MVKKDKITPEASDSSSLASSPQAPPPEPSCFSPFALSWPETVTGPIFFLPFYTACAFTVPTIPLQ